MTTGRVNQVSLQETCCFARRLNKQAFLHYLDALLLFLKESPEDLAQPVRQAYDYWSFLGRKHAVSQELEEKQAFFAQMLGSAPCLQNGRNRAPDRGLRPRSARETSI